jgi:putative membrane protein
LGRQYNILLEEKMRKLAVSVALAAFIVCPAVWAQSVGEKTGVNSALGVSPSTADFVKEAANSDMLEIASAKLAEDKGNADEKKFAQQMITDHGKTTSELKGLVSNGDVKADIPAAMEASYQSKLDKLRDAKPADFSKDYDSMQVSAHKDAVSLFERYSKSGDNPKLKDWAGKTLPTLRHHLDMAEALEKNRSASSK